MTENKKAEGLEFLLRKLNPAANDKDKLVDLAHEAICSSHTKRTFTERRGKGLDLLSLNLGEARARIHLMANREFTTDDKLYFIIKRYVDLAQKENPRTSEKSAINEFCTEFQKRYPKEYGAKSEQRSADVQKAADKSNIAPLLMMKSAQNHNVV